MNTPIKRIVVKCLVLVFWLTLFGKINAQERSLIIIGTAESNYKPLANAKVTLYKKGVAENTIYTGSDGIFKFNLSLNDEYTVMLEKPGMLSKKISFNTELPDDATNKWTVEFAMGLFPGCEGVDTKVLNQPVDVVKFSTNKQEFISDITYAEKIRSGIEKLLTDIENCQAEKSQNLLKQADDLYDKKQYEESRSKYQEILKIFPDDSYCQRKITEIDRKIGQDKLAEQKYNSAITEADRLYAAKNFELAKAKYQEAMTAMPGNKYASDKIATIDNLLNAQKSAEMEKLDKEKQYNSFISKANLAFSNKNLEEAKSMYQQALLIKPDAAFPQQKIAELDPLIAKQKQDLQNHAANDKAFNEAMAMGQAAFQKNDLATAQQYYNKALTINPQSSLPREKITEIEKFTEQQKMNEAKAQKAETEKKIIAALDEGDLYFKQKKFDEAEAAYQRALQLNPKEAYAKQQVDKIYSSKQAADVEKQKTLEKNITESISKGDNLIAAASYQQAIEVYKQALVQKPNDPTLLGKLANAEQKLAVEQQKKAGAQAKQKEYDQLLLKGNELFASKNYVQAKDEYQKALNIFPDNPAAKEKITEIDKILSAQKQQEQYKALIVKADGIFAAKDYMQAKMLYQQALTVKPDEIYPQQKVTEIDKLVSENKKLAAEQAARDEQFKKFVSEGDRLLATGKIAESKLTYQNALNIKPDDKYTKDQISKIDLQVAENQKKETDAKMKEQQFNAAITQGDQLFASNKNQEAKVQYQQALALKPGDAYPATQIVKIDARLAEQLKKETDAKAKDQQYNAAIAQADQLFAANKNLEAKVQYQQALSIKTGDGYPTAQIAKIDARIAELLKKETDAKVKEQQFNAAIAQADQLFAANKNQEAKVQYQQALAIRPGDGYPTAQITKIDARIAEQVKKETDAKAKEQQFNTAIAQADQLFAANKNLEAKVQYQQALTIKPGDSYPTSQIAKIDARIAEQLKKETDAKAKEQQYKAAIAQADQLYAANKKLEAKVQYQQAISIKPGDTYSTSQIAKIDLQLADELKKESDLKANELKYKTAITQADQFFNTDKLIEAKAYYEQALAVKPAEKYPAEQVKKVETKLLQIEKEKQAKLEFEEKYNSTIKNADIAYDGKDFVKAREFYNVGLTMKPSETYPRDRLNKITEYEKMLAKEKAAQKQTTTSGTTEKPKNKSALAELKFANDSERDKYLNSLRSSYPVGVTLEVHNEEFRSTRRYIVIRDNEVREFRMVKFNWGGVEYSLNGIPVTGQYFDTQVKVREGEAFQEIKQ